MPVWLFVIYSVVCMYLRHWYDALLIVMEWLVVLHCNWIRVLLAYISMRLGQLRRFVQPICGSRFTTSRISSSVCRWCGALLRYVEDNDGRTARSLRKSSVLRLPSACMTSESATINWIESGHITFPWRGTIARKKCDKSREAPFNQTESPENAVTASGDNLSAASDQINNDTNSLCFHAVLCELFNLWRVDLPRISVFMRCSFHEGSILYAANRWIYPSHQSPQIGRKSPIERITFGYLKDPLSYGRNGRDVGQITVQTGSD